MRSATPQGQGMSLWYPLKGSHLPFPLRTRACFFYTKGAFRKRSKIGREPGTCTRLFRLPRAAARCLALFPVGALGIEPRGTDHLSATEV